MSADMPEVEAYADALVQELEHGIANGCSVSVTARRVAALASLHETMDPWQPCPCQYCALHLELSRYF